MANRKTFDELEFTDDYLFCKILTENPELCKELLELILDIKIKEVKGAEEQKGLKITYDSKGVRFDVYVEDAEKTVYDIEIQTYVENDLPKRMRYYQGMMDVNLIKKNDSYSNLKKSYVIFICTYDPFGNNLPVYTFRNVCIQDNTIDLNDEAIKVAINSKGDRIGLSEKMVEFLDFLEKKEIRGEFSKRLELAVKEVKYEEKWRLEYMTLYDMLRIERKEGFEEGEMNNKIQTAKNMLEDGSLTNEQISKYTGLSAEEVAELRDGVKA